MKVKNRAIGSVCELVAHGAGKYITEFAVESEDGSEIATYSTIEELLEYWETYKPTEPLIKDEKIRKAVRAWAEANNINSRHYYDNDMKFNSSEHELTWIDTTIQFNELGALEGLEDGKRYTIDELCGEEEE